MQAADVPELVREHFKNGQPLSRLLSGDEAALKCEIVDNRAKAMAALAAQQKR